MMPFFPSLLSRESICILGQQDRESSSDCFEEYCEMMDKEWGPDTSAAEVEPQQVQVATTVLSHSTRYVFHTGPSGQPGTLSSHDAEALPQEVQAGPSRVPAQLTRTPEFDEGIEVAAGSNRRRAHSDDSDEDYAPSGSLGKKTHALAALPKKKVKTEHVVSGSGASSAFSSADPSASPAPGPGLRLKASANGIAAPIASNSSWLIRCCIGNCGVEVSGTSMQAWRNHICFHHPKPENAALVQCGWTHTDGTVCEKASGPDSRGRHIALVHLKDGDACPVAECTYVGRKDAVWRHMGTKHGVHKRDRAGAASA